MEYNIISTAARISLGLMDFIGVQANRLSRALYALAQDARDCLREHAVNIGG